jgi:hypothetical protein
MKGWIRSALVSLTAGLLCSCGSGGGESGEQKTVSVVTAYLQAESAQAAAASAPAPRSAPTPPASTEVDVLLVLGQSNASGSQVDQSIAYPPDPSVLAWNGSNFTTYLPNQFTGIETYGSTGRWAADLRYVVQYRAANPTSRLVVLRYTAGGTQLAASGGAVNDWNTETRGRLFDGAGNYVQSAMSALRAAGLRPRLRLVWWQQGESDMSAANAPSYQTNLTAFVAALRDPAGQFATPSTSPIVIGRASIRLLTSNSYAGSVRTAQTAVAHADVGGPQVLMDDDDLPFESDNIHLTRASQLALGDRLWAIDQGSYREP